MSLWIKRAHRSFERWTSRYAICVGTVVLWGCLGVANTAAARQISISAGVGLATPKIVDPVGYMSSISGLFNFDDSFGGYLSFLHMGFPAKPADYQSDYDSASAGAAGVEYRLSVGGTVPYLRAGGGLIVASGTPAASAPMVEFAFGVRWRLSQKWYSGAQIGRYAPMDDFGDIGGGGLAQLLLGYRMDL